MDSQNAFAVWLRRRRRAADMTQAELAQAANYALSTIRKLEGGELAPSRELAARIATIFNVPAEEHTEFAKFARGRPSRFAVDGGNGEGPGATSARDTHTGDRTPILNLPTPLTALVGREEACAEVTNRLRQPAVRLLTLTGAPGTGKTRLSIAAADALRQEFPDGIHFAPLAPISDPSLVLSTLAHGLGVNESDGENPPAVLPVGQDSPLLRQLGRFLAPRQMLLVLDNFEQVLEAAPALGSLLKIAPALKVLVTSRALLRVYGEFEYAVPPLALPQTQAITSYDLLCASPAVRLFAERAQLVQPAFVLTPANAPVVAHICTRLDGLPLAIEMAAAQLKWQSLDAIDAQLATMRLGLRRAWRDADPRQQTLRGAIEWSYQLLRPEEQRVFASLGVFAGGGTPEAALAVCEPAGGSSSGKPDALDRFEETLRDLVERSLLEFCWETGRGGRYSMLETLREYALEQLAQRADERDVIQRHAVWYTDLAGRASTALNGPEGTTWMQRLETEQDNFRVILQRFEYGNVVNAEHALTLVAALSRFWHRAGFWMEGERWQKLAVARGIGASDATRARVLRHLASSLVNQGQPTAALAYGEQSLALARTSGEPGLVADILYVMGYIQFAQQALDEAQTCLAESLALLEQLDQRVTRQNVLDTLGYLALSHGDYAAATDYYRQLEELARNAADFNALGNALNGRGEVARAQGAFADAVRLLEESLRMARETGTRGAEVSRLPNLAFGLLHLGAVARARDYFRQGLVLSMNLGDVTVAQQCLAGLAQVAVVEEEMELAAYLAGAVQRRLAASGRNLDHTDQVDFERTLAVLEPYRAIQRIGEAWTEGAQMTLEEVAALALR